MDLESQCVPNNTSLTMEKATKLLKSACTDDQLVIGKKNISFYKCKQDPCVEVTFYEPCDVNQYVLQGSKKHPHLCQSADLYDYDEFCGIEDYDYDDCDPNDSNWNSKTLVNG